MQSFSVALSNKMVKGSVPASLQSKYMVQKPNMVTVRLGNYEGKSCMFTKTKQLRVTVHESKSYTMVVIDLFLLVNTYFRHKGTIMGSIDGLLKGLVIGAL